MLTLSTSRKTGLIKSKLCYLSFFEDRIVCGHLGNDRLKSEMAKFQEAQESEGKGFFGRAAEAINFYENYSAHFNQMTAEDILGEDPENFVIPYIAIKKFRFERAGMSHHDENDFTAQLIIQTADEKHKFNHKYRDSKKEIKQVLEEKMGKALKYT